DVSITNTVWGPRTVASATNGRASDKTNRARIKSCRIRSHVSFRGRQGTADETGSPISRHSIVEGTLSGRRLERNMYSTTRGPARAANPRAAGTRNLIARPLGERGLRGC